MGRIAQRRPPRELSVRAGGGPADESAEPGEELIEESADLVYHLLILLQAQGLALADVVQRLRARHTGP